MKIYKIYRLTGWLVGVALLGMGCEKNENTKKAADYKGPVVAVNNIEMILSDSARLSVRLTAPVQIEQQNGDRIFPKGVYVEFYDKKGVKTSTLRADKGYKYRYDNVHKAEGNVIVTNLAKQETLRSELLNWNPDTRKLYTDKFVTITTPEERLEGTGLDAAQDLSTYTIHKPTGIFPVSK